MDCSTSPNASHFLRKLQNSEMAILEQISIHKSTSIFKAKLIELEEFLQNSHRQRHLSLTSPNSNSSSPLSIDLTAPRFGHKPSLPQFPDSHCFNVLFGPITKNNIGNHLKKAFEQLDDIPGYSSLSDSAAYIDGMQKLLAAVAKSIKTFLPFLNEDQLLLKVSGYAIAKIPKEKQIEFNARYDRKSLLNLMRFLRKEILIFYENFTDKRAKLLRFGLILNETKVLICISRF